MGNRAKLVVRGEGALNGKIGKQIDKNIQKKTENTVMNIQ